MYNHFDRTIKITKVLNFLKNIRWFSPRRSKGEDEINDERIETSIFVHELEMKNRLNPLFCNKNRI